MNQQFGPSSEGPAETTRFSTGVLGMLVCQQGAEWIFLFIYGNVKLSGTGCFLKKKFISSTLCPLPLRMKE